MFDVLSFTDHEDDVSGRKLPSKISLRSFKFYRVHSSQDCLPVPDCLLCVFTFSIQRRRRKFYVVVVQWSSIPKCTKQNGMLLQLLFWLLLPFVFFSFSLPLFSWLPKFPDIEDTALILLFKIKDISSQKLAIDSIITYYEWSLL